MIMYLSPINTYIVRIWPVLIRDISVNCSQKHIWDLLLQLCKYLDSVDDPMSGSRVLCRRVKPKWCGKEVIQLTGVVLAFYLIICIRLLSSSLKVALCTLYSFCYKKMCLCQWNINIYVLLALVKKNST